MSAEKMKERISRTYMEGSIPQIWNIAMAFVETPPEYPRGYITVNPILEHKSSIVVYARHPDKKMEKILFFNDGPIGRTSELGLLMERWDDEGETHMAFSVINARKLFAKEFEDNEAARVYDVYQNYRNHKSWDGSGVMGDGLTKAAFEDVVEWMLKPDEIDSIVSDWFGIAIVP